MNKQLIGQAAGIGILLVVVVHAFLQNSWAGLAAVIVALLILYGMHWCFRKVERSARPSLGPTHDAMVGKRLRRIGFAVIAASLASFAAIEVVTLASVVPTQYAGAIKGLVFLTIPLLFIGFFILSRGRQYLARADSAEPDPRPPVVLLRPFQSDAYGKDLVSYKLFTHTFEEHLAAALRPIGPLVALGRPEEVLPPAGASRFYTTNETWKDRVDDLFKKARVVVLIFDTSPAVLWETDTAFRILKPQQLLILGVGSDTPREYEALSRVFKEATGRELPDRKNFGPAIRTALPFERGFNFWSGERGITFGEGWTPRILRLRAPFWRGFAATWTGAHLHFGVEPIFRANGIEWHPYPVSALEILYWLIFVIFCLLALGTLLLVLLEQLLCPQGHPLLHRACLLLGPAGGHQ